MEDDNKDKLSTGCILVIIVISLLFFLAAFIIVSDILEFTGILFSETGFRHWLLVIAAIALFIFLVMLADKRPEG